MRKFETKNSSQSYVCQETKSASGAAKLNCRAVAPAAKIEVGKKCHRSKSSSSSSADSPQDNEVYDYIIVGAGTAGAPLAAKLSDPNPTTGRYENSVLVIESGKDLSDDPAVLYTNFFNATHQNFYFDPYYSKTLVAFNYGDNPLDTFSLYATTDGRMWGGSSGHNGLQAYRPSPNICNYWADFSGNDRWTYNNLLVNDMIPMEHYTPTDQCLNPEQRGTEGPNFITEEPPVDHEAFYQALANFTKAPLKDDLNDFSDPNPCNPDAKRDVGVGSNQDWITPSENPYPWGGEGAYRSYTGNAYLTGEPGFNVPAIVDSDGNGLHGRKLKVLSFAYADRVLFSGNTATGVQYQWTNNNKTVTLNAKARKKVILSSGAFYDPSILMRSGVGDPAVLEPLGIPVVATNLNVGRHMKNHNGLYIEITAPTNTTDITATITNAVANGATVTFTANNNFIVGEPVTISGVISDPAGAFNLTGTIATVSATQFTVASTIPATTTYTSGGTATVSSITNVTGNGQVVTVTFSGINNFVVGQSILLNGVSSNPTGAFNTGGTILTVNGNQVTFQSTATGTFLEGGTATSSITTTNLNSAAYGSAFIDTLKAYLPAGCQESEYPPGVVPNDHDGSNRRFQLLSFTNGQFYAGQNSQEIGGYYVTPRSEGNVEIQTPEPSANPFVTFNFFSDGGLDDCESDLSQTVAFFKEMIAFTASLPGAIIDFPYGFDASKSDAELAAYIKANLSETYHNACTCRMSATAADGVLNGNLHVHGVKNLMVASTASLPQISDGNTSYSARLVGLEAARIILSGEH